MCSHAGPIALKSGLRCMCTVVIVAQLQEVLPNQGPASHDPELQGGAETSPAFPKRKLSSCYKERKMERILVDYKLHEGRKPVCLLINVHRVHNSLHTPKREQSRWAKGREGTCYLIPGDCPFHMKTVPRASQPHTRYTSLKDDVSCAFSDLPASSLA